MRLAAGLIVVLVAGLMIFPGSAAAAPFYSSSITIDANPIGLFSGKDSAISYEILFDMGQKNQTLSVRNVERQYDFQEGWESISGGGSIKNGQFLRISDEVNVTEDVSLGAHTLTLRFQAKLANETAWSDVEKSMTIYVQKQSGNAFSGTEIAAGVIIAGALAIVFYFLIRRRPSK
jgi:hypothetical protein